MNLKAGVACCLASEGSDERLHTYVDILYALWVGVWTDGWQWLWLWCFAIGAMELFGSFFIGGMN